MNARDLIPAMTDPMGRYWSQPSPDVIAIDEQHAVMTAETLGKLLEYSTSLPSGVYTGKMWRCALPQGRWLLCWYADEPRDPKVCRIEYREVLLA